MKTMISPLQDSFNKIVRGVVVANNDPKGIGRIQVRIYNYHGTNETGVQDAMLPWAFPCFPYASYNSGSFIIPEVGTTVWLLFEDGNKDKPVYIGSMYGIGTSAIKWLGNTGETLRYQPAQQKEVPKELTNLRDKLIYKSPKGNKIIINDNDGMESISIVDSCGQVIRLSSPMSESFSRNNAHLDNRTSLERDFNRFDGIINEATVVIKGLGKSLFRIISSKSSAIIDLIAEGSKKSSLKLLAGSSPSVVIDVDSRCKVSVDPSKIKLSTSGVSLTVENGRVFIDGPLYVDGNVEVDGYIRVRGIYDSEGRRDD